VAPCRAFEILQPSQGDGVVATEAPKPAEEAVAAAAKTPKPAEEALILSRR